MMNEKNGDTGRARVERRFHSPGAVELPEVETLKADLAERTEKEEEKGEAETPPPQKQPRDPAQAADAGQPP